MPSRITFKIEQRKLWCPRDRLDSYWTNGKVVVHKNCADPPSRKELAAFIKVEEQRSDVNLGLDLEHLPNVKWLLMCLSTLNPLHPIFSPNYVHVGQNKTKNAKFAALLPNPNGMYTSGVMYN